MRGKFRTILTIVACLLWFSLIPAQAAPMRQTSVPVLIYRDVDALAIYIGGEGYKSLVGFTLESVDIQGNVSSRALNNFPSFVGLQFDRVAAPVCFIIENANRPMTLPLECQELTGGGNTRIFREKLTPANLFWYDSVAAEQRLLTITDGTTTLARCPGDQQEPCQVPFVAAVRTATPLPPTQPRAYTVVPASGTVVVRQSTPFRAGPGPQYPILETVKAGTYTITGINAEKTYLQLDFNGREAWISAFALSVKITMVTPTPAPKTTGTPLNASLVYNQTIEGQLGANQKTNYTFVALAGEQISVIVSAKFDSYLELYDPTGFLLVEDDNGAGGNNPQINGFKIPKNGEYRIVLRGYSSKDTGVFTLSLYAGKIAAVPTGSASLLVPGTPLTNSLTPNGQAVLPFDGSAGDVISITVKADFDSYLQLQDASGKILISDDDSGGDSNPLISLYTLTESSRYQIVLRGRSASATGTYTIMLLRGFAPGELSPIKAGETVSGQLEGGKRKVFAFTGTANQRISVSVLSDFDAHLTLHDTLGMKLADDDDSGGNLQPALVDFKLPRTGTYYLVLFGNAETDQGKFNLKLTAR